MLDGPVRSVLKECAGGARANAEEVLRAVSGTLSVVPRNAQ